MFKFFKKLLGLAAPVVTPVASTTKEPPKCGCRRSPTGYCVGLHNLSDEEWAKRNAPSVNDQITDSEKKVPKKRGRKPKVEETVTSAPAPKKPRKPRSKS